MSGVSTTGRLQQSMRSRARTAAPMGPWRRGTPLATRWVMLASRRFATYRLHLNRRRTTRGWWRRQSARRTPAARIEAARTSRSPMPVQRVYSSACAASLQERTTQLEQRRELVMLVWKRTRTSSGGITPSAPEGCVGHPRHPNAPSLRHLSRSRQLLPDSPSRER